jgi:Raf kinase inhibitor-like YbhB/YbcL family protein
MQAHTPNRTPGRWPVCLPALPLLAACVLAGCGGSSSTSASSPSTIPASPAAASTTGASYNVDAVAHVASSPISKTSYAHWLAVESALGASADAGHRALAFLITSDWVIGEAAARGISVSEAEVKRQLGQLERQSFPQAGSLRRFLAKSRESEADLLARVKVELLKSRIGAKITAGVASSRRSGVLAKFQQAFHQHWKTYTTCDPGYVMEDCSQYKGGPEDLAPPRPTSSSSGASGSLPSTTTAATTTAPSAKLTASPGAAMAIASPAFGQGGAIPAQYTCDGANVSPALEWVNVPAKADALVLFVIDERPSGSTSGIRWVVANIDPHSKGMAAGQVPAGGVVGSDTQGEHGYGGICPPRGGTSTVKFVLYALSKKIAVSPGFPAGVAESEYGSGKLVLGEAATFVATYHRP